MGSQCKFVFRNELCITGLQYQSMYLLRCAKSTMLTCYGYDMQNVTISKQQLQNNQPNKTKENTIEPNKPRHVEPIRQLPVFTLFSMHVSCVAILYGPEHHISYTLSGNILGLPGVSCQDFRFARSLLSGVYV